MDGIATSSNACGRFMDEPMDGILDRLSSGELADIDGGAPLSVPTRAVVIERSLAGAEAELLRGLAFKSVEALDQPARLAFGWTELF